ncbi:MAG TPA: hypothetical protein VMV10_04430 [Pirellulales bacterium]|nr:hypothetical protein [Pirellulales bacterium]
MLQDFAVFGRQPHGLVVGGQGLGVVAAVGVHDAAGEKGVGAGRLEPHGAQRRFDPRRLVAGAFARLVGRLVLRLFALAPRPAGRILAVKAAQHVVQFAMPLMECDRTFEETFGRDGEELGAVRGAVVIEQRGLAPRRAADQPVILARYDVVPMPLLPAALQRRHAVHLAVDVVEVVGEFVKHEIAAVRRLARVRP